MSGLITLSKIKHPIWGLVQKCIQSVSELSLCPQQLTHNRMNKKSNIRPDGIFLTVFVKCLGKPLWCCLPVGCNCGQPLYENLVCCSLGVNTILYFWPGKYLLSFIFLWAMWAIKNSTIASGQKDRVIIWPPVCYKFPKVIITYSQLTTFKCDT